MYADRANMILMTGFLITGMITVPIALIILWHLHSKKRRELKLLKENLRYRNMYPNYMVPPGSAHDTTRMFATMEGPYDPQRWPSAPTDPDHWQSMRVMLGSRDQPRQLGSTTGPAAGPVNDSFVLGGSGQFVGPIYRANMVPQNPQPFTYAAPGATYNPMLAMQMSNCQMHQPNQSNSMVAQSGIAPPSSNAQTPNGSESIYNGQQQWRPMMCQPQPPASVAGSTGSLDWVQNMSAVPRQIDVSLDHANTVGGCGAHLESDADKAVSDTVNSQHTVAPPPLQTKKIPASQLAS